MRICWLINLPNANIQTPQKIQSIIKIKHSLFLGVANVNKGVGRSMPIVI
jgi:hypothetical protein